MEPPQDRGNGQRRKGRGLAPDTREVPSRILIVLPNWVGDAVLATPALRAIRTEFPDAHVTILCRPHLSEVLAGGDWMNDFIHWPSRRRKSRSQRHEGFLGFASRLRELRYDWAVLLANSFRSAMLARLAGIPRRIGYDRDGRGLLLTDRLLPERENGKFLPVPMIRYYNAIARYLGCRECPATPELFVTDEENAGADAVLQRAGVSADHPFIVLNPGASFGPAKRWLPGRFAQVADHLVRTRGVAVFVSCGPKESGTAHQVGEAMQSPVAVLDDPVVPLGAIKALIRRAQLLVTNDTGPRHFANAFGTPVVTVYGPTDPEWTRTEIATERSLMVEVDCGPCMKRTCPLDHRCMTRVTSQMVIEQAEALLGQRVVSESS